MKEETEAKLSTVESFLKEFKKFEKTFLSKHQKIDGRNVIKFSNELFQEVYSLQLPKIMILEYDIVTSKKFSLDLEVNYAISAGKTFFSEGKTHRACKRKAFLKMYNFFKETAGVEVETTTEDSFDKDMNGVLHAKGVHLFIGSIVFLDKVKRFLNGKANSLMNENIKCCILEGPDIVDYKKELRFEQPIILLTENDCGFISHQVLSAATTVNFIRTKRD